MSDTYRFSSVCVHECACVSACVRVRVCREKKSGIGTTDRKNKQKKDAVSLTQGKKVSTRIFAKEKAGQKCWGWEGTLSCDLLLS